jgi:uncharacterized membrane protein
MMDKSRLEAFSDGVIAIAITLLVLEIKVPVPAEGGADLTGQLAHQWPSYAAYVVSFLTIGVIWINHHATIRRIRAADHTLLVFNLLLLLVVGVLPWTTALLAEYLREPHGANLTAMIYGGSFLLVTMLFYLLQRHILFGRNHLLHDHIDDTARRRIDRRNRLGLAPYVVATAAGAWSAYLTLALCALIAVYYALPSTAYEAPADDTPAP